MNQKALYRQRRRYIIISAFLCCGLAVVLTFAFFIIQSLGDSGNAEYNQSAEQGGFIDWPVSESGEHYSSFSEKRTAYAAVREEDMHRGPLILVNAETEYQFPDNEEAILSVYEEKNEHYKVSSRSEALHRDALQALNLMTEAFFEETGLDDIMVNSSYRTLEEQKEVYQSTVQTRGEAYAETYVSAPGYSEHHTGLAADLAIYTDEGAMYTFDGRAEYNWVYEHCAEYGFVMRYPENKTDVTGIGYESWHFRYVTVPHALAMTAKGLCLEEYIEYIQLFTYDGERLTVAGPGGEGYEIYFVEATGEAEQQIPVPEGSKYEISGNNVNGYAVAVSVGVAA